MAVTAHSTIPQKIDLFNHLNDVGDGLCQAASLTALASQAADDLIGTDDRDIRKRQCGHLVNLLDVLEGRLKSMSQTIALSENAARHHALN